MFEQLNPEIKYDKVIWCKDWSRERERERERERK